MTNNILTGIIRDFILHESFVVSTCNKESELKCRLHSLQVKYHLLETTINKNNENYFLYSSYNTL